MSYQKVLDFWFNELKPQQYWNKDQHTDDQIRTRFLDTHNKAKACELFEWRTSPHGRLAEIIVLDQFSRSLYRHSRDAFLQDPLALALAQEAVHNGVDKKLATKEKLFLYMPYMHSESLYVHKVAEKLFLATGLEENYKFEMLHKNIIDRFGRYPHRNKILGRKSSPEELEFLKQPGSSF